MSDNQITAGKQLQQAREQSHMSLTELSEKTKIPVQCLKDVEQDYHPSAALSIYTRGHIKLYCEALQIPAEPIIEALQKAGIEYIGYQHTTRSSATEPPPWEAYVRIEYIAILVIWLAWVLYYYTTSAPSSVTPLQQEAEIHSVPSLPPIAKAHSKITVREDNRE